MENAFFAVESFLLNNNKSDIPYILNLIDDKVPVIYFHAISAALTHQSEEAVGAIFKNLSSETWQTESFYLQAFDKAPLALKPMIEKRLYSADEPSIRATCFYILLKFPPGESVLDEEKDLNATYLPLKFAAIKYAVHVLKEKSIPLLKKCLTDPHWEIRSVTLQQLGSLKDPKAATEIAQCLQDQNLHVKLSAIEALKKLGKAGENILNKQNIKLDSSAYEISQRMISQQN